MSKFAPYHETFRGKTFTGYTLGLMTPAGMLPLWVVSHALEGNERTISVFTTSPGEAEQPALSVDVLGENGNASAITRGDNIEVTFNTCTFSATWQPLPGGQRESGSLLLAISERHGDTVEHLAETRLSASDIIQKGSSEQMTPLSPTLEPNPLSKLLDGLSLTPDEAEDWTLQPEDGIGFPDNYIVVKTALHTVNLASDMVTSESLYDDDGEPIEGADSALTPAVFAEDELTVWTLDLGLSDERVAAIETLVNDTIAANLPEGSLRETMENQ